MTREWKPGDVAISYYGRVFRTKAGWRFDDDSGPAPDSECRHVRPLVVIDPENREQVERLEAAFAKQCNWSHFSEARQDAMQATLREFADPMPPKPDEPMGLGAVVEAIYDNRFVHIGNGGWQRVEKGDTQGQVCTYDEVAVLRVLSEGVQP